MWLLLFLYSVAIFLAGLLVGQNTTLDTGATRLLPDATTAMIARNQHPNEPLLYPKIAKHDFGPYKEFSVVHSDRSLNLMSPPFQHVMKDLSELLKATYHAEKVAIIPGSGTFGMESVARHFAVNRHVLVLRNGYFSYRWTQIFDAAQPAIPTSHTVLKAQPVLRGGSNRTQQQLQYTPHPIEAVLATIEQERPAVVFAPHVETSTGIMLPDEYIRQVADQVHAVDGILVLDCIASGTIWIDMQALGVDVVISAPQKDWTSPPSSALIMLSPTAVALVRNGSSSSAAASFSLSLPEWLRVMDAYEQGSFAYHTTLPTDALREFQRVSVELLEFGLPGLKQSLTDLGQRIRHILSSREELTSVAAAGFEAPGVLVYYSPNNSINMVQAFHRQGIQIANGVRG